MSTIFLPLGNGKLFPTVCPCPVPNAKSRCPSCTNEQRRFFGKISVDFKVSHVLGLVVLHQDGESAGVDFGGFAERLGAKQVRAPVQDDLGGLGLAHTAEMQHIPFGLHQFHAAAVEGVTVPAQAARLARGPRSRFSVLFQS